MQNKKIWAIVPAAGIGSRMQADIPKQYLQLLGKSILQRTLERLNQSLDFEKIVVVLNPQDPYWPKLGFVADNLLIVDGGTERSDSVFNGLAAIAGLAAADDWVFVHDAARPCVRSSDLCNMLNVLDNCGHGGLLAAQVKDTMKRGNEHGCVDLTVERENLWHALTPQAFPFDELFAAYRAAAEQGHTVTDEAMAVESAGGQVKLVPGRQDNIKITRPEDLKLAELYLHAQADELKQVIGDECG